MKNRAVDEFIKYAKEQFGCDLVLSPSCEPDTFEKIFGDNFLGQDVELELENGFYENVSMEVEFSAESIAGFSDICDIELAA